MQDFSFSTGAKRYPMNGTYLVANLADNNLYHRFLGMQDKLREIEKEYVEETKGFSGALDLKGFPMKPGGDGPSGVDIDALNDEQYDAVTNRAETMIAVNYSIDQRIKALLREVFGPENNFDEIFNGVNVMALDGDGKRILWNFLEVVTPLIEDAQKIKAKEVDDLVGNRAARRARNRRSAATDGVQS